MNKYTIWQDTTTKEWLVSDRVIISVHKTEKEAKAAVKRYEAADKRRAA